MSRFTILLFLFFSSLISSYSQVDVSFDTEYSTVCLLDSINALNQVEFNRIYHINRDTFYDKTFDFSQNYTPTGTIKRCDGLPMADCCSGDGVYFDISQTGFLCSKIAFDNDNAFTSLCPDGWDCQDLADRLNEGNPTGSTFDCDGSGNLIVIDGEVPEFIRFFTSGGGTITVNRDGAESICNPALSTKECNSEAILLELQAINSNTCNDRVESNIFCASTNQLGLALVNGGTVDLTAGQEILVTRVLDCNGNPQSFSVSVLILGVLEEIADPVDAGDCPVTPDPPLELGCITDEKGVQWQVFQSELNGNTTTFYVDSNGVAGTPSGDPNNWTGCEGVDFECKVDYVCSSGITLRRLETLENGQSQSVSWLTSNGVATTAPATFTWGACFMAVEVEEVYMCADGEDAVRVSKYDVQGNRIQLYFEKPDGTVFIPTTFNDCGGGLTVTNNDVGVLFAYGQQDFNTNGDLFNASVTRTNVGRYTVTFGQAHPNGSDYSVTFGTEEPANTRDVPKISLVEGTRTANGFNVQVTVDDNGGAADPYVDEPWSFQVAIDESVVTSVIQN